ncbi:sulfite exporter TauE/SafE family protein [Pseudoflavonifractor phocaeensis]|uniref:sulfite exporter TauE/SafE family protein n=1 Tax=Pseudoflavonifractor phocaeensis TaxID=1870988 RepID=UPI001956FDE9|nr:sulfite exporter TauE/SafE family protein [Pseudoflavonifractor phocaeensis]MBM6926125.1 sulfite exporter TauE/SafE family protein [Pseudoflavonifractor phocaeensis]
MQTLFDFLVCIIATTIGGISGVGGGVIIKPVMDATSGLPVATISFLSGCTVLAMTITSMVRSIGGELKVEPRRGTLLAIGGAVGGIVGKELFELVRSAGGAMVSVAQQVLMIALTLGVLAYTLNRTRIRTLDVKNGAACLVIGLVLGVLSSFLGIGGGPINLAVLFYFFSMDSKTAALNSLYIILFSQGASFLNTVVRNTVPQFEWTVLAAMVAGGVLGGTIGRSFSRRMDNRAVDRLFFWLLLVITGISVYNLVRCFH